MGAHAQERAAIAAMLKARAGMQTAVAAFLEARAARGSDAFGAQQRLQALARRIAVMFGSAEAARVEAELLKLAEQRDNHIFKGLAALAAPGVSLEDAAKTAKARLPFLTPGFCLSHAKKNAVEELPKLAEQRDSHMSRALLRWPRRACHSGGRP